MRDHWRELGFWRWWWHHRVPAGAKLAVITATVAVFLSGGFFAANRLASASAGLSTGAYSFETTVQKVVTVREHGKVVVKRVPVVRRIVVKPLAVVETVIDTRVITTPGGARIVQHRVVRTVPVVRRRVVTINGKTTTLTQTRLVRTTQTQTQTQTQTSVVTNQNTTTVEHTRTETNTRTETQPVTVRQTETQTVTVTQTQTLPPDTVTQTVPVTVTQTITTP